MLLIQPYFEYDVSENNFNVTEGILLSGVQDQEMTNKISAL